MKIPLPSHYLMYWIKGYVESSLSSSVPAKAETILAKVLATIELDRVELELDRDAD